MAGNAEAALTWAGLAESSAREVVREYRGAISEEILPTMTTAPTLDAMSVDALYDHRSVIVREQDLLSARLHDVDEAIARATGSPEWESWHRLMARALRTRDPKDEMRADVAWADAMAAGHLRMGTRPLPTDHRAADIVAAILRIAP